MRKLKIPIPPKPTEEEKRAKIEKMWQEAPMDYATLLVRFKNNERLLHYLKEFPDDIEWPKDRTCKNCGKPLVAVYECSPAWTWANLCGLAGYEYACPYCGKLHEFQMTMMN